MADKNIGALPAAALSDDTLLVAEKQGTAVRITAAQVRKYVGSAADRPSTPSEGGSGDMSSDIYDPQCRETDIFQYIDDLIGEIGLVLDSINGTGSATMGGVKVLDIGSAGLDIATLDFSQYAAGDVILVVSDMDGGAQA